MTQYGAVGSYIIFEEVVTDMLGRLCRAGEFDASGVRRTVWLRIFDAPGTPGPALAEAADAISQIAAVYKASNSAANPVLSVADGTPLYAFDHLPAQPLERIFTKVKDEGFPVPVDNALLILEKIALALAGALAVDVGSKRLFHGFLLPAFVLVSNEGEAQVSGFGLGEEAVDILDSPQAREAAAPYLAPEVLSARNASKKSDVYSLGAILFQLLTGDPLPVDPAQRTQALAAPTMAYDYEPIPGDIMGLLKKALSERPEDRFSSAADFKKELDKLLYGGNYSPTTFNLALFMDRLFRNEIEAEEKARSAEDSVDVAPYLVVPEPEPEPEPEPVYVSSAPPAKSNSMGLIIGGVIAAVVIAVVGFMMLGGDGASEQQAEMIRQMEERLAQREAELEAKFNERQQEIEDLEQRLQGLQENDDDETAKAEAEELRKKLAAAEAQKRREEQQLAAERRRLQEQQAQANLPTRPPATATPKPRPTATPVPPPVETTSVPSGSTTEVPTSAGGPSALSTPTPVPTPTPVRVSRNQLVERAEVESAPEVVRSATVSWPRAAKRSRQRGVIILSALVNADGEVEEVKVLRADDTGFGIPDAAQDSVRNYVFKPASKGGVQVKTWTTVTIPYNFQ